MSDSDELLRDAAERAIDHAISMDRRAVTPRAEALAALARFDEPLSDAGADAAETLRLLADVGGPATIASPGPSYFGFVTGGTLPAALGAAFLATAWDQNAALPVMSPVAAALQRVTRGWLIDLLGLAADTEVVHVTGATVANATCLAAARDALLAERGWDAPAQGLFDAPAPRVVIGEAAHSTLRKSLAVVGLGGERVIRVPADGQGRMRADRLPDLDPADGPILICAQAGEVNTGAFDPFAAIADWAARRAAWLHVDGAFGLWALADPEREPLVGGLTRADSLATDAHKWLNVPYDSGIAFVQRPDALRRSFAATAGYLPDDREFEAMHHTPQSSQRARQIEVWAALRVLGREGVAALVRECCECARLIGERLAREPGFEVLNEVVLNQVLVRLRDGASTAALVDEIQRDGRIWCGATVWNREPALRISVSSWMTGREHAVHAAEVVADCARRVV